MHICWLLNFNMSESSRFKSIIISTISYSAISVVPKLFSIVKDGVIAYRFGVSNILDAFLLSYVLISVPVSIVGIALQTALVPVLVSRNVNESAKLLGHSIKFCLIMLTLILPLWLKALPYSLKLLYPSVEFVNIESVFRSCVYLLPYYFTNGVNLILYASLQAKKIFWPNAIIPSTFPIFTAFFVLIIPQKAIYPLIVGTVIGSFVETVLLLKIIKQANLITLKNTEGYGFLGVLKGAFPLIVGGLISSFIPVAEQLLAYRLGVGSVSLINYGYKVPAAINGIALTAIGVVALPHLAELAASRAWVSCFRLARRISIIGFIIGVVVASLVMLFSKEIIALLFERGAFSSSDTPTASQIMSIYICQFPFLVVSSISIRSLVALNRNLIITLSVTIQFIITICLGYYLSNILNIIGIPIAISTAVIVSSIFLLFFSGYYYNVLIRNNIKHT